MENVITSKSNEKAKFIKSLNDKKGRIKNNCFYLEGIKVVNEVLDKKEAINLKFIACSKEILENVNGGNNILERLKNYRNLEVIYFSKEVFESLTDTKTPQGILAVIEIPKYDKINDKGNILILDKIQDTGNIGTIIRSADAFGIDTIVCTKGTVDCYSPKVLRSTMGSILREKIIYLDNINEIKNIGYTIVGTVLDDKSISLENLKISKKMAFVMGNEANGISDEIKNLCDIFVKIPMTGNAESLNVAVATSIILYKQFEKNE